MGEYIKREDAVAILTEKQRALCPAGRYGRSYVYGRERDEYDAIEADIDALENLPAADVCPVVRGNWIMREHKMMGPIPSCSECGWFVTSETNFCPNCGADMRIDES